MPNSGNLLAKASHSCCAMPPQILHLGLCRRTPPVRLSLCSDGTGVLDHQRQALEDSKYFDNSLSLHSYRVSRIHPTYHPFPAVRQLGSSGNISCNYFAQAFYRFVLISSNQLEDINWLQDMPVVSDSLVRQRNINIIYANHTKRTIKSPFSRNYAAFIT